MGRGRHTDRVAGRGKHRYKPTITATFGSIPDGVMFHQGKDDTVALLKWKGQVWAWSPEGYLKLPVKDQGHPLEILTPKTVVDVHGAGYVPGVPGSGRADPSATT